MARIAKAASIFDQLGRLAFLSLPVVPVPTCLALPSRLKKCCHTLMSRDHKPTALSNSLHTAQCSSKAVVFPLEMIQVEIQSYSNFSGMQSALWRFFQLGYTLFLIAQSSSAAAHGHRKEEGKRKASCRSDHH
ncbi:uncharacterized protein UTRI_05385 [Ustilago trichophora]|uniref:Uncharacterized protein n=1 Tax=Ustilago trichophora TaxID=86804 RepID=A0A5C3EJS4_9BASI|nr:uncharacterized protein UTRI_05385 [Ustilago trichophora]